MILPELLKQEGSAIGCACCAPCGKLDEMLLETGLEMVNLTMVSKMSNYPESIEDGFSSGQTCWLQASGEHR